ncbi:GNAT family N-acetyltransferase [Actinopolymorpha pittospori]|uniref:Ribosomal protein S18 acetylase RimI-like enzyme n=1 Tax=Actinopolymorpha pittospori TaxID=648752 RepID=A0A927RB49_9ACTN|nr:ribosomal protein S18 acetylase RimI-like enzyme [Actinopolymorpha pittospori]
MIDLIQEGPSVSAADVDRFGSLDRRVETPSRWPTHPEKVMRMPEVVLPLTVRDLTVEDLHLHAGTWGWSATHVAGTAEALERARRGEIDFLAVCPPSGVPVATGAVDYTRPPGGGSLEQLSVDAALRSCGIGTILIEALEHRIRARGLTCVELGVDENKSRPRALYERLGYIAVGRQPGAWDEEAPDGTITRYETMITVMRKQLSSS